jgi:hypothetical protein
VDEILLAELAIDRLQRAYADVSTRRAWDEFATLATPDARFSFDTRTGDVIELDGLAAFAEFGAAMTAQFSFYEYVPLNFVVDVDPVAGTARGRAYQLEIGQDRETSAFTNFYGMYHDDYARVDGQWWFTRRQYQSLARWTGTEPMVAFPIVDRAD